MKNFNISFSEEIFFTSFNDFFFLNHRSALENLSSLEKKYSEQAKTMQQEILVFQKNAKGIFY